MKRLMLLAVLLSALPLSAQLVCYTYKDTTINTAAGWKDSGGTTDGCGGVGTAPAGANSDGVYLIINDVVKLDAAIGTTGNGAGDVVLGHTATALNWKATLSGNITVAAGTCPCTTTIVVPSGNTIPVGSTITFYNLNGATLLNGTTMQVTTSTSTSIVGTTSAYPGGYGPTSNTGTLKRRGMLCGDNGCGAALTTGHNIYLYSSGANPQGGGSLTNPGCIAALHSCASGTATSAGILISGGGSLDLECPAPYASSCLTITSGDGTHFTFINGETTNYVGGTAIASTGFTGGIAGASAEGMDFTCIGCSLLHMGYTGYAGYEGLHDDYQSGGTSDYHFNLRHSLVNDLYQVAFRLNTASGAVNVQYDQFDGARSTSIVKIISSSGSFPGINLIGNVVTNPTIVSTYLLNTSSMPANAIVHDNLTFPNGTSYDAGVANFASTGGGSSLNNQIYRNFCLSAYQITAQTSDCIQYLNFGFQDSTSAIYQNISQWIWQSVAFGGAQAYQNIAIQQNQVSGGNAQGPIIPRTGPTSGTYTYAYGNVEILDPTGCNANTTFIPILWTQSTTSASTMAVDHDTHEIQCSPATANNASWAFGDGGTGSPYTSWLRSNMVVADSVFGHTYDLMQEQNCAATVYDYTGHGNGTGAGAHHNVTLNGNPSYGHLVTGCGGPNYNSQYFCSNGDYCATTPHPSYSTYGDIDNVAATGGKPFGGTAAFYMPQFVSSDRRPATFDANCGGAGTTADLQTQFLKYVQGTAPSSCFTIANMWQYLWNGWAPLNLLYAGSGASGASYSGDTYGSWLGAVQPATPHAMMTQVAF